MATESISAYFDTTAFKELNSLCDIAKRCPNYAGFFRVGGQRYVQPAIPATGPWECVKIAPEDGKLYAMIHRYDGDDNATLLSREKLEVRKLEPTEAV